MQLCLFCPFSWDMPNYMYLVTWRQSDWETPYNGRLFQCNLYPIDVNHQSNFWLLVINGHAVELFFHQLTVLPGVRKQNVSWLLPIDSLSHLFPKILMWPRKKVKDESTNVWTTFDLCQCPPKGQIGSHEFWRCIYEFT